MSLRLSAGELAATVDAGAFLAVDSLSRRGVEVLAAAEDLPPAYSVHGRSAGITLLHPWANRLSRDTFEAQGFAVELREGSGVGRDQGGLPIHGLRAPSGGWRLTGEGAGAATARLRHEGSTAFPFAHEVEVRFELEPQRLVLTTTVRATTDEPVPLLLGWHPYLRLPGARDRWRLALPPRLRLALDDRSLPTGDVSHEPAEVAPLGERTFDDHFGGLADGSTLAIEAAGFAVRLVLETGFPYAQVFAPRDADVVSLEPMSAPIDAYVTGAGCVQATQDEPVELRFSVEVSCPPAR